MRKVLLTIMAAALAGTVFVPVWAQQDDGGKDNRKFVLNGMVRGRMDYINNYTDLTDNQLSSDPNDDGYTLFPIRAIVGVTGNFSDNVKAHVDFQYIGHFGDEPPQKDAQSFFDRTGNTRLPYYYFAGPATQFYDPYQFNTQGVQLYQGYVELDHIGGSDFALRIGRQEHTSGTELFLGDNSFYAGLSFDGVRGMWQHGSNDLNVFYYRTAENHYPFGGGGSVDSNLYGATYDWHFQDGWGTVGGYLLIGQDGGGSGPVFYPDSKVNTFGARWNRPMADKIDSTLNMFDWNVEYAVQRGDIGQPTGGPKTDISASVAEAWFGFNFNAGSSTHGRVHVGTLMTSGDDANTTDKYEGFIPLYGDFHAYNRFGDMDFIDEFGPVNITDFNVGYDHWFAENHHVGIAYHKFKLTEKNGATEDDLGDEIDLKYCYKYSKNVSFQALLGQENPGKALEAEFGVTKSDAVQRVLGQVVLTW